MSSGGVSHMQTSPHSVLPDMTLSSKKMGGNCLLFCAWYFIIAKPQSVLWLILQCLVTAVNTLCVNLCGFVMFATIYSIVLVKQWETSSELQPTYNINLWLSCLLGFSYIQENRGPESYIYLFCPSLRQSISSTDEQSTISQFPNPKISEKSSGIDLNWWKAIYSLHLIHLG